MTLGDLYPDVRLNSEVETIIMTGGGCGGEGEMGGGSGRRVGGDTNLLLICRCVLCDLMGKFELYGGMFLDWEG